jgi:hypothetical protein
MFNELLLCGVGDGVSALPLLDYNAAHFFTLTSFHGGSFSALAQNPLHPLLAHYFSSSLDMRQTTSVSAS